MLAPSSKHPHPSPLFVGVAGGSGAGKTTLVQAVAEAIGRKRTSILPHDAYYRDRSHLSLVERAHLDYDHPASFETDLLLVHIKKLRHGCPVPKLSYDYASHRRLKTDGAIHPEKIMFVEGILVLAEERLRRAFDLRIFVDAPPDVRVVRRILRDAHERGRGLESVVQQYLETVRPAHQEFVEPSRKYADLIVSGEHHDEAVAQTISALQTLLRRQ